ncbi:MAG: hypothetical protein COA96_16260 [SAR86 cluster bacterium]|uniref:Thiol:disulfide interchange protein DsbD N-terminal domain-containing protein n=1 Tax=SAR86 cluster bacterium TaxID=2030880 RepID=A0A2A5AJH5_9GAMM|nr:MAG: hypothetical protein COA96_16260 [SAR86 cluster bacterium]
MSIKRLVLVFLSFAMLSTFSFSYAQLSSRTFSGFSNQAKPLLLDQAFPFFVSVVSPGQYKVVWNPAEGHYLYRHAFDFSMQQAGNDEELKVDYVLPDGLKKTDQFFGDIEAYYNNVSAELSLSELPDTGATLFIQYQGCADWGFCYPPQRYEFALSP